MGTVFSARRAKTDCSGARPWPVAGWSIVLGVAPGVLLAAWMSSFADSPRDGGRFCAVVESGLEARIGRSMPDPTDMRVAMCKGSDRACAPGSANLRLAG